MGIMIYEYKLSNMNSASKEAAETFGRDMARIYLEPSFLRRERLPFLLYSKME
jgi:hypothetical protein